MGEGGENELRKVRMQSCKLNCCHMKSLNKSDIPISFFYALFVSRSSFIDFLIQ